MDLKNYYRKIREVEAAIPGEHAVLVSRETPEGGRAGLLTEAPRHVAARLVVEGAADLASPEQAAVFRSDMQVRQETEQRRRAAARIQINVISQADADLLAGRAGPEA